MFRSKSRKNQKQKKTDTVQSYIEGEQDLTHIFVLGIQTSGIFSLKENVRLDEIIAGEVKCENKLVLGGAGKKG